MTVFKSAALAAIALATASPAFAQTAPVQPAPAQTPGAQPLANDGPYAGTSPNAFYHPDDRIRQIQGEIPQGALTGRTAHEAMAQLTAIRQDLQDRMARHNGQLLDWDRELINQKLDALVKQYAALRT